PFPYTTLFRSQRVADLAQHQRLRGEDLAGRLAAKPPQLRECSGVERSRPDAAGAELFEPAAHLTGRLVREGNGEDLLGREGAGRDLVRYPPRHRGRLA